MSDWIKVSDRLPILDGKPVYHCKELVIGFSRGSVRPIYYARQMYNKTEKGRLPRWEDMHGLVTEPPTHWQPLPAPPTD